MEKKINEIENEKGIEKNMNVKETVTVAQEVQNPQTAQTQEVVQEEHILQLKVEREPFTGSDGKKYWSYITKGQVRGRSVKVDFSPKDKGGYEPLDIVFSIAPVADLIMANETMTDVNGKVTYYTSYKVRNKDKFGVLECEVKPSKNSDKALLGMIISELKALAEMQQGGN